MMTSGQRREKVDGKVLDARPQPGRYPPYLFALLGIDDQPLPVATDGPPDPAAADV